MMLWLVDMWLLKCSQWFLVCFHIVAKPETLTYDCPSMSILCSETSYILLFLNSRRTSEHSLGSSCGSVKCDLRVFALHSWARFLITSPSHGTPGSQPCPLSDPRPTAVCLFCGLWDMWGKTTDVTKIYQHRHVSLSFCIILTVSVKRDQERERQDKQRDRDPLFSKCINCCFLCLLDIFQWLMLTDITKLYCT